MNTQAIIEGLKLAVTLVCGGIALYLKFSTKAQTKAKQVQEVISNVTAKAVIFIKEAEEKYKDTTNMGGTKFNEVVTKLHSLVPDPLKNIITEDMIADIVQSAFDEIEEYVQLQLDNAIDEEKE